MDHEIGEEKRHLENQGIPFRKDKISNPLPGAQIMKVN